MLAGCVHELKEELGIDIAVGRLLCLEWVTEAQDPNGALQFVYDGGILAADMVNAIVPKPDELEMSGLSRWTR